MNKNVPLVTCFKYQEQVWDLKNYFKKDTLHWPYEGLPCSRMWANFILDCVTWVVAANIVILQDE